MARERTERGGDARPAESRAEPGRTPACVGAGPATQTPATAMLIRAQTRVGRSLLRGTFPMIGSGPHGRRLAFPSDRRGNYDIDTMNSAGRDLRRITTNPGKDAFPSWSPNGRTLAFASNRTGNCELYTTNANGSGHLVRVTHRAGV